MVPVVFLLLFLLCANHVSPSSYPDRFTKSFLRNPYQQYFQITRPLQSDSLTPSSSHSVLNHSFANTINGPPFSIPYSPPSDCPGPWSHVVLELRVACKGEQYDRIAGIWLGGAEILRSSTAEPTESGIFWKVRKDITRYSSLLARSDLNVTMMLENIVNDVYTGVYHVEVVFFFYKRNMVRFPSVLNVKGSTRRLESIWEKSGFNSAKLRDISAPETEEHAGSANEGKRLKDVYDIPADLIIPISQSNGGKGFWFWIESESDLPSKRIHIPPNTHRAILELYVSFHGNDEFWYSNPPDSYIKTNNLTTGRGNGAFREVFVTIDGKFAGSEIPFPVIFTGGINPLFWEPVVGIGAFDLPSYDFDLTPFLGKILDGKVHSFGIGVGNAISYWLVDANLHLWLDFESSAVQAESFIYHTPKLKLKRHSEFELLDGSFRIKAERKMRIEGWVKSSAGNLTAVFSNSFEFKNLIKFENNGTYKKVKQKIKAKKEITIAENGGTVIINSKLKRKYPLEVVVTSIPSLVDDTYLQVTNISHALSEKNSDGYYWSSVTNRQESGGWMRVKDHSVLSGSAFTYQNLSYQDDLGCYRRTVTAADGSLIWEIQHTPVHIPSDFRLLVTAFCSYGGFALTE